MQEQVLSQEHPFIIRDYGLGIIELINIDPEIDASHKSIGALNILCRKFKHIVLTLPPQCALTHDVGPQLKTVAEKINLKLVFINENQIPFNHEFLEVFNSTSQAILRLKSKIVQDRILEDFTDVTPFKSSAMAILDIINQPDASYESIEEAVVKEPLLVARILQTANSAFYMRRSTVENVKDALAFMGMEGIKQVLMQLIFHNLATKYFVKQEDKLFHCEACSHLAYKLAQRVTNDKILLGKIRIAGLLHDIGTLALHFSFSSEYEKVEQLVRGKDHPTLRAEQEIFGTDHCEVGKLLCRKWKLPEYIYNCVSEHHHAICAKDHKVVEPVTCANAFLDNEIDSIPSIDYSQLLAQYCAKEGLSFNEAKLEVKAYLYQEWRKFKAEHESAAEQK